MAENSSRPADAPANEAPLESWKEIAAYLKRDVRTVKRWEKSEGLPVHRHLHQARSSVYAYPNELEAWWAQRRPALEQAASALSWRRPASAFALATVLLLALVSSASSPIVSSVGAAAAGDGSGIVARQVWAGPDVDVLGSPSADGRYLTYVDWSTGDLAVHDLTTGEKRRLTNKGPWTQSDEYAEFSLLSPDGQQIAYAWFNEKFYELRLIGFDGSTPRVLYRNEDLSYVQPAAWSPDGKRILTIFARQDHTNQIAWVSVPEGSVQVLKTFDWRYPNARLSPDGSYVVYDFPPREDAPERDLYLLAADGKRELAVVEHPAHDFLLGWSPDGSQVVFASDRTGTVSIWAMAVADGRPQGHPRLVRQNVGNIFPIGITPKGSLFFGMGGLLDVYVAEFDTAAGNLLTSPQNVTHRFIGTNYGPSWSPDGRSLAYVSRRGPPRSGIRSKVVVIRDVRTGEERVLTPPLNLSNNPTLAPSWSPDGRYLLLAGSDQKGRAGFYRLEVETAALIPIVQSTPGNNLALWRGARWSPDGQAIFFQRQGKTSTEATLVRRELATGQETVLYGSRQIHAWALSPDGRQLAFTTEDEKGGDILRSDVLKVIPAAGGEAREVLRVPGKEDIVALVWTPDGRSLLFGRTDYSASEQDPAERKEVWRIAVAGGEPVRIGLSLRPMQLSTLRFHPDGKRIAFTVAEEAANEVWMLENFLPVQKASR